VSAGSGRLRAEVLDVGYHRRLISCQDACTVHTDARGYVRAIAEGRFEEAYLIARGPNPFASIRGRICGAPCEATCRRGKTPQVDDDGRYITDDRPISIRALKRFACERFGVDAQPPEEVWESARSYIPEVCADVEELAAMLRASTRCGFEAVDGERVAIIGAGPPACLRLKISR
jgi:NADPH-dependent glutamate synthase beta subunit-like oxidoreductase